MVGINEKSTLPNAMDPTRNVINLIAKIPIFSLNKPTKHIMPMHKFKPPYIPAISEYPICDLTAKPTASKNDG